MVNMLPAMYHRDIKPLNIVLDKPHPQKPNQKLGFASEFLLKSNGFFGVKKKNCRKGTAKMVDFGVQDPIGHAFATTLPRLWLHLAPQDEAHLKVDRISGTPGC